MYVSSLSPHFSAAIFRTSLITPYRLTAIMTSRFILDLREAADPRHYDDLSTNGGGISTLVFPTTSQHTPCFDSNPCLGTNAACSAGGDDAEREVSLHSHITVPRC